MNWRVGVRWMGLAGAAMLSWMCSDTSQSTGAGGAGGSVTNSGAGGISDPCGGSCMPDHFCSVSGECIPDGTCAEDGDCGDGLICSSDGTCVPGGGCDAQEVTIEHIPPNLLISLDRSCSMNNNQNPTKWEVAEAAIEKLTTDFAGEINFGLALFPDIVNPGCAQDAVDIPVAPDNESAIQTLLSNALVNSDPYFPNGPCVTNIDTAMEQALQHMPLYDTERQNFVLLITDGKQYGCNQAGGDNGTTQIIGDMLAADIATFVVGFGNGVDPDQLDVFAQAGGVANPDPNNDFYPAEDQMTLDAALAAIAAATLSCEFVLESVPEDPTQIWVFFDNDPAGIPQDENHTNGWDYDPASNTITFYGEACDRLQSGVVMDVDVVLGCAAPTPN